MDELRTILVNFNLSDKEAAIYLANLECGPTTGYEIAKRAGVKQPTVYALIESLKQKGFLTTREEKRKLICVPTPPRQIISLWHGRLEGLEAMAPELNALFEKSAKKPRVLVYEGQKGVEAVYNSMLSPLGTGKDELLTFGAIGSIFGDYGHLMPTWYKTIKDKRNRIRDLVGADDTSLAYAQRMLSCKNPKYSVRVFSARPFGETDMLVFRNRVAIISLKENLFSSVIESEAVATTMRALFESAWAQAQQIQTR